MSPRNSEDEYKDDIAVRRARKHATFQEYCDAVLNITRQHAYRLIRAEAFKARVNPLLEERKLPLIETERHVRELKNLSDDKIIDVIAEVTQDSPKDPKKAGAPAASIRRSSFLGRNCAVSCST